MIKLVRNWSVRSVQQRKRRQYQIIENSCLIQCQAKTEATLSD